MKLPLVIPVRFCPSKETLGVLNEKPWICSYSGGKDSTTLVTWIEWLRRVGMVRVANPRLVLSDTGVEYPFLGAISAEMMAALRACDWSCDVVRPAIDKRLYVRIFGIGNSPVHPGGKKMRWCTRSTKIDPMKRFAKTLAPGIIQLSGVRFGESKSRDDKIRPKPATCSAGGECGLPEPRKDVYGPIIDWPTCKVVEWVGGRVDESIREVIADLLPPMARLYEVYDFREDAQTKLFDAPPTFTSARFGCIGCPAISREKVTRSAAGKVDERWAHLRGIYRIWEQCYAYANRCVGATGRAGPLRLEARKRLFGELLEIQRLAGIELVSSEEETFIRRCWDEKRYPKGWTEADELTPESGMLFQRPRKA